MESLSRQMVGLTESDEQRGWALFVGRSAAVQRVSRPRRECVSVSVSVGDAVLCFALQCAHMVVRLVFPADHTILLRYCRHASRPRPA